MLDIFNDTIDRQHSCSESINCIFTHRTYTAFSVLEFTLYFQF